VSVLIVVGSTAVAVGVAVFALVALHPRQTSSAHPVAATTTHHSWLNSSATIHALAESAHKPIAPALIEQFAIFDRRVPPPATIEPLPEPLAARVARSGGYGPNVADARFVPYPGTSGL
jgi:hypothetical protein